MGEEIGSTALSTPSTSTYRFYLIYPACLWLICVILIWGIDILILQMYDDGINACMHLFLLVLAELEKRSFVVLVCRVGCCAGIDRVELVLEILKYVRACCDTC